MTINVPEASLQDIFDFVAAHLMTQGVVSEDQNGQCVYRSPDGLKCAIGCLIPDDAYRGNLEGREGNHPIVLGALGFNMPENYCRSGSFPIGFSKSDVDRINLLLALQQVHDDEGRRSQSDGHVPNFKPALVELARDFNLSTDNIP